MIDIGAKKPKNTDSEILIIFSKNDPILKLLYLIQFEWKVFQKNLFRLRKDLILLKRKENGFFSIFFEKKIF